tara:strand:- start:1934 stop:2350 length:417 start_codon:yes stop_codon:yes gene_type:complete
MSKKEEANEIAFKDFKKSITKGEFNAVLNIAKEEYKRLSEVVQSAHNFAAKASEGILDINDNGEDNSVPPIFAKKLIEGLKRKANQQLLELFTNQIHRSSDVVDFINRFKKPGKELEYLNFTFLKEAFKKQLEDGKKE